MTKQDFKTLQKENKTLRESIDYIIKKEFSTIDDDYSDIWENINNLITNEIEQEKECGE